MIVHVYVDAILIVFMLTLISMWILWMGDIIIVVMEFLKYRVPRANSSTWKYWGWCYDDSTSIYAARIRNISFCTFNGRPPLYFEQIQNTPRRSDHNYSCTTVDYKTKQIRNRVYGRTVRHIKECLLIHCFICCASEIRSCI